MSDKKNAKVYVSFKLEFDGYLEMSPKRAEEIGALILAGARRDAAELLAEGDTFETIVQLGDYELDDFQVDDA